ncbi:MAG: hypothetical protein ACLFV4_13865 [Candidatus Hydrogenedentota bacterium]
MAAIDRDANKRELAALRDAPMRSLHDAYTRVNALAEFMSAANGSDYYHNLEGLGKLISRTGLEAIGMKGDRL